MERYAIDPFSLLDSATNECWGKWILAEEIARHGLNLRPKDVTRSVDSKGAMVFTLPDSVKVRDNGKEV